MSWDAYITGYLVSCADCGGHAYENSLTQAAIYTQAGAKCCSTAGFDIQANEIAQLVKISTTTDATCPTIAGKKYQIINQDQDKKTAYLKITGGGAVVACTNTLIIVGVFKVDTKSKKDGNQKGQNQGDAATLVENCQTVLTDAGM